MERETGLGGDGPAEPDRTGVNCRSENSHLRLLAGPADAPEGTDAKQACNTVTRVLAGENADDPILARLAALREHWRHARDLRVMRRGLLDLLQELEES